MGLEESAGGGSRSSTVAWLHVSLVVTSAISQSQGQCTPRYLCAHGEMAVPWDGARSFPWTLEAMMLS